MHIVQKQVYGGLIQIGNTGIAHCGQNAAQIGVAGKKGGFDQWRMRNRVGHLSTLLRRTAVLYLHGDELGRTLTITHDGLSQAPRHIHQSSFKSYPLGACP